MQSRDRPLPATVRALLGDIVSRSMQAAEARHALREQIAAAAIKLRERETRVTTSVARQLGLADVAETLDAARAREVKVLTASMERVQARGRRLARRRT